MELQKKRTKQDLLEFQDYIFIQAASFKFGAYFYCLYFIFHHGLSTISLPKAHVRSCRFDIRLWFPLYVCSVCLQCVENRAIRPLFGISAECPNGNKNSLELLWGSAVLSTDTGQRPCRKHSFTFYRASNDSKCYLIPNPEDPPMSNYFAAASFVLNVCQIPLHTSNAELPINERSYC